MNHLIIDIFFIKADKDKNGVIDKTEFRGLWAAMKGEGEVRF